MTVTREQVADLQPGDVVEVTHPDAEWTITGPLVPLFGGLGVAGWAVTDVHPASINARLNVRVVSRAPRPLYVNHPRTEPVPGDVVRNADDAEDNRVWLCDPAGDWWTAAEDTVRMAGSPTFNVEFPKELWLLVDGETGQVVP